MGAVAFAGMVAAPRREVHALLNARGADLFPVFVGAGRAAVQRGDLYPCGFSREHFVSA